MTPPLPSPKMPLESDAVDTRPSAAEPEVPTPPPWVSRDYLAATAGPTAAASAVGSVHAAPVWQRPPGTWTRWASSSSAPGSLQWRELVCVALLVVLSDLTVYRAQGFAGCAALFLIAPGLLLAGSPRPRAGKSLAIVAAMLLLLAARTVWLGSALEVAVGFALLVASAMAVAGRRLYVLDLGAYAIQTIVAGGIGMVHYVRSAGDLSPKAVRVPWLSVLLPLGALALFGTLFVLANPDLATSVADMLNRAMRSLSDWIERLSLNGSEVVFCIFAAWVVIGLLRPIVQRSVLARFAAVDQRASDQPPLQLEAALYPALRNTLLALIALFAVYLVFEFKTLWFRTFPKGFYYAGYAHEGAAWLTASLALATIVLSAIFRGQVLCDRRLPQFRRLAWIWSAENLVLAATVYNRLWIYVTFNGMTRMRTVALFGVTAVVAGVVLVIAKIVGSRDFAWLVRRHLAALALAIYLFALAPVDALVHTYNVRRVLAGDLAPSVQISVHPIDAEGILVLHPLLESDDEIIREGIRAMLAERAIGLERSAQQPGSQHWTAFQLADRRLSQQLDALRSDWVRYADSSKRAAVLNRFHTYAYQWY